MLKSLKNANKVLIKVYEWTLCFILFIFMINNNLKLSSFNTLYVIYTKEAVRSDSRKIYCFSK